MMKIITALAVLTALAAGVSFADESVDCYYEANASHPLCRK